MTNNLYLRSTLSWRVCLLVLLGWAYLCSRDWQSSWAQAAVRSPYEPTLATVAMHQKANRSSTVTGQRLQGKVWKDANGDGLYQLTEPFLPQTTVLLYRLSSDTSSITNLTTLPLLTTTTTITGWYTFDALAAGSYALEFITVGNMFPTTKDVGSDDTKDSDIDKTDRVSHGRYPTLALANRAQAVQIDAGFVQAAQATIYVYEDMDLDNQREIEEPVILNSVVILYDSDGKEVERQIVDQRGAVTLSNLLPGNYTISVWPPSGYSDLPDVTWPLALTQGSAVRVAIPVKLSPKAITLINFTITVEDNMLVVRWQTGWEQNTYGYHVSMHSTIAAAVPQQLTTIVRSQGSAGGLYEVRLPYDPIYDGPVEQMEFWLIEHEISGKQNPYGPFALATAFSQKAFLPLMLLP